MPSLIPNLSISLALPTTGIILALIYLISLAFSRLYLSPIAHFPGPKLAALSRWYEFYYEVVLNGQFTFHIQNLHAKYGPIVRITPEELHVSDSEYWDYLYKGRYDKYEWSSNRFGNSSSVFTTSNAEHHRLRRAPLNPMFSRKQIVNFQPTIRQALDLLCMKLAAYKDTGRPVALNKAWSAFAGDVITEFAFGKSYAHLESEEFQESFDRPFFAASKSGHVALQFPWIVPVMNGMPVWFVVRVQPLMHLIMVLQRDIRSRIKDIIEGRDQAYKDASHPTIFHELLQSDLPPQEKTVFRLAHEAQTVIGAGLLTTGGALTAACFHVINNPAIFHKLRQELTKAIPDPKAPLDWPQLEQLPYLSACIREGVRLSYGISGRTQRMAPDKALRYKDWLIPPNTPVSMTIVDVHHDESIFPDSHSFIPERWLDNPRTKDGGPLDRYYVAFGKGPRSCLGINLAYAEMYMAMAAVFRRFRFELFETDESDVVLKHDWFVPSPREDSRGMRVKVVDVDMG